MPRNVWLLVVVVLFGAATLVAGIGGGHALTLPAQRHMVRVVHPDGAESLYLALQQGGLGPGLRFYRSDDRGGSWHYEASIQPDATHRDTADLLTWDRDVALVYSYEGPSLSGSSRHDVYFQWWRYDATARTLRPSTPVRVFDATSDSEAYYRAELVRDSLGRIWVQAFHLRSDGRHIAELKVSADGGQTFSARTPLADLANRGGGRLLSLDGSLLFLYDAHQTPGPTWFRTRLDTDPIDAWKAPVQAFADGVYHGAALSTARAGNGRFHLAYQSKAEETLWYRFFDGTAFGPRQQLDGSPDWALQAATAAAGSDAVIFYNHVQSSGFDYDIDVRTVHGGVLSPPVLLDDENMFKGYPATLEQVPPTWTQLPCVFGFTLDADSSGEARAVSGLVPASGAPDAGTPPDAGTSLTFDVSIVNKSYRFQAVARDGTALALKLDDSRTRLYASTDGARTWAPRVNHTSAFTMISTLSDGTLIADVTANGSHFLSRSGDTGQTWRDIQNIGTRRMLTPHSVADLDGTAFFAEYQTDTSSNTPINLWASTDQGRTWTIRFTFQGHRHAHGLRADATHHALWIYFGDSTVQSGVYQSADGGFTWTKLLGGQPGDVVDAVVTADGLIFGQDISNLPDLPSAATLSSSGAYVVRARLPGPAYSSFGLSTGGYVVGTAHEPGGDVYAPGDVSAHVVVSSDGITWTDQLQFVEATSTDYVRADVYWELPSGELVLQLYNALGFGPGGMGYELLRPVRR